MPVAMSGVVNGAEGQRGRRVLEIYKRIFSHFIGPGVAKVQSKGKRGKGKVVPVLN
jgi:hypothetical protein